MMTRRFCCVVGLSMGLMAAGCGTLNPTMWTPFQQGPKDPNDPSKWTMEVNSGDAEVNGPCRIYDELHRVMAEGGVVKQKMDGVWTWWASDGTRIVQISYRGGIREGAVKMWYGRWAYPEAAGKLKLEGAMANGQFDGPVTRYDRTGGKESIRYYETGNLKTAQLWTGSVEESPGKALQNGQEEDRRDRDYFIQLEKMLPTALEKAKREVKAR